MAPVTNARVLFNEIPSGLPIPGQTTVYDASQTIDPDAVPLDGGFLVKTLVLSIDPYMRGRMRDTSIKSYAPAYITGEPIQNYGVGLVFRSENDGFKPKITFTGTRSHSKSTGLRATPARCVCSRTLRTFRGQHTSEYVR